jgi:hypothetical protein
VRKPPVSHKELTERHCSACGRLLPIDNFFRDRLQATGHRSRCRDCSREYQRDYLTRRKATGWRLKWTTPQQLHREYRRGARVRGLSFKLTVQDLESFWRRPCAYCGEAIETVGLDRVDNTRGYELGNVVPCCHTCNLWKGTRTVAEFRERATRIAAGGR